MLECVTTLTVAATATRSAVLGTCVLQLPLRQPAVVAKQAAALQLLSGGRFVLGVGVGSHPGEYQMAGVDFAARGRLIDEGIAGLHRAWRSADEADLPYRQEPAVPPVPVWIGGSSGTALRRAAASGDGWIPLFLSPDEYVAGLGELRDETIAVGRQVDDVLPAVVVMVCVGQDPGTHDRGTGWLSSLYGIPSRAFDRHLVAGPAGHCAEQVQRYLDGGAEHVAVMVADDHALDHFAELVGALSPALPGRAPDRTRPDLVEVPA
jgi:alkanesulfonate monooxygenase SsuD/methylene tetrahydromethanopterin reductase-like flavin-dependent oxidoreductase (luciferase family)